MSTNQFYTTIHLETYKLRLLFKLEFLLWRNMQITPHLSQTKYKLNWITTIVHLAFTILGMRIVSSTSKVQKSNTYMYMLILYPMLHDLAATRFLRNKCLDVLSSPIAPSISLDRGLINANNILLFLKVQFANLLLAKLIREVRFSPLVMEKLYSKTKYEL